MKSDVADVVGGAWLALGRCLCTLCIGKSINLDPGGEVEGVGGGGAHQGK